ncbi:GNAT family N-acetyltransferase [Streptomyces himalayensis]|uniref:GNAT family N-acetyltransferase n=1 Tax=Streptomyces himalayensis TaxID=2820085 RepID=UPI002867EA05|nr:GNAT family N-acetyltransferase [Streptomyces himalayensis]
MLFLAAHPRRRRCSASRCGNRMRVSRHYQRQVGYRIGERAAGRGIATAAVGEAWRLAVAAYRLSALRAVTILDNPASMTVLERNGFTAWRTSASTGDPVWPTGANWLPLAEQS